MTSNQNREDRKMIHPTEAIFMSDFTRRWLSEFVVDERLDHIEYGNHIALYFVNGRSLNLVSKDKKIDIFPVELVFWNDINKPEEMETQQDPEKFKKAIEIFFKDQIPLTLTDITQEEKSLHIEINNKVGLEFRFAEKLAIMTTQSILQVEEMYLEIE